MVVIKSAVAALLAAGSFVVAHPGEHHDHDEVAHHIAKRTDHANSINKRLAACAGQPEYEALKKRGQERRIKKAEELRQKRGIPLDSEYCATYSVKIGQTLTHTHSALLHTPPLGGSCQRKA